MDSDQTIRRAVRYPLNGREGVGVPITPFLTEGSFDPEAIQAMCVAFVGACRSLGLTDTADPMARMVATEIIEAAEAGERDPVKLHEAVMLWAAHSSSR